MTTSGTLSTRAADTARALRASMRGRVLLPGDLGYDSARTVWNGAVDRHPAVIARCAGEPDVIRAVRACREHGLPLSVRGGGHDWDGRALRDGGLVIDLTGMRGISLTPAQRTLTAGGGATAGDVVAATRPHGLAPVTGTVKAVGMTGLTLAGGYGPLLGKHGLALDNLLSARVVLADGSAVTASAAEQPDLFWALRGGGGTFGVVTEMTYRVHPLESVWAGLILFPLGQAETVLRGYMDVLATAPDELMLMAGFFTGPDGQPLLFLSPTWSGDMTRGERVVADLQRLGAPAMAQVAPMAYEDALSMFDPLVVNGRHYSLRTRWLTVPAQDTWPILAAAARGFSSPFTAIALHHFHGAASRVGSEDTAFALRRDHLMAEVVTAWAPDDADAARHERWADDVSEQLRPYALPGGYPNLLPARERGRTRLAYGSNLTRLREIKRRWDPEGVFSSAPGSVIAG